MFLKVLLGLLAIMAMAQSKTYEKYKVYSVVAKTAAQVAEVQKLQFMGYDIWTNIFRPYKEILVLVKPERDDEFLAKLHLSRLDYVLKIEDVQSLINLQRIPTKVREGTTMGTLSWNQYHTVHDINAWLDELQVSFPNIVKTVSMGTSTELRDIKGVVINYKKPIPGRRTPLIGVIEGGMHGREWISPSTATWVIKEFLTSTNSDVRHLAESFVWHIFPIVNPDGYAYSFTDDRMWKKNRSPLYSKNCSIYKMDDDMSNGVDINHNFNLFTENTLSAVEPCSPSFAGSKPHSEAETVAMVNYLNRIRSTGKLTYYFSFHSFGEMIILPSNLTADHYHNLLKLGHVGVKTMNRMYGADYVVGDPTDVAYEVIGSSVDYANQVAKVPITFLFQLRDRNRYGFLLPTTDIILNGREIMAALVEIDKEARLHGYFSGSVSLWASMITLINTLLLLVLLK